MNDNVSRNLRQIQDRIQAVLTKELRVDLDEQIQAKLGENGAIEHQLDENLEKKLERRLREEVRNIRNDFEVMSRTEQEKMRKSNELKQAKLTQDLEKRVNEHMDHLERGVGEFGDKHEDR